MEHRRNVREFIANRESQLRGQRKPRAAFSGWRVIRRVSTRTRLVFARWLLCSLLLDISTLSPRPHNGRYVRMISSSWHAKTAPKMCFATEADWTKIFYFRRALKEKKLYTAEKCFHFFYVDKYILSHLHQSYNSTLSRCDFSAPSRFQ